MTSKQALHWITTLALAIAATTAQADYSATATAGAAASLHSGTVTDSPANATASSSNRLVPLVVTQQAALIDPALALTESSGGYGWASVQAGGVRLSASGTAFVQGGQEAYDVGGASGYGYASGGFSDTTIWNVAGVAAGQTITVDFQIRINGDTGITMAVLQGGTASGFRTYEWDLRFAGIGVHNVVNSNEDNAFGIFTYTTQLTVGAPIPISFSGSVSAGGTAGVMCSSFWGFICDPYAHGASVQAFADLSHTLAWNGVTGLRVGDTALQLSALSVTSDSGFDYTQAYVGAVPEPSSAALLGIGLAAFVLRTARRRAWPSAAIASA